MDEYISKKDILQMIESTAMWNRSFSVLYEDIEDMKPADVAPVRHGRWIIDSAGGKIACSDCGCIYLGYNGRSKPNYCPNCGAEMNKEA